MQRGVQVHELIRGLNASTIRITVSIACLYELINVLNVDRIVYYSPYPAIG
nr:MAG TPA: hypothetical protein [Caudoviricetes sp.]